MNTENQKILAGIKAGDKMEIRKFYDRNFRSVCSYVMLHGGSEQEAEDIFQDAILLIYQKAESNTLTIHKATVHTYFYAVCKNLWSNQLRYKRRFVTIKGHEEIVNNEAIRTEERQVHADRYRLYKTYFQQLSTSGKQMLQLVTEGNSMKDIAQIMGYSEGYARKKKFKIKKNLSKKLRNDRLYQELVS